MFLLFLGFLQIAAPSDRVLIQRSKNQANYYIQQIDEGTNVEENLWALITLGITNENIRSYIEKEVTKKRDSNNLLNLFKKIKPSFQNQLKKVVFKTGSRSLFVALLLSTKEKRHQKRLYRQFISKFDINNNRGINYYALYQSIIGGKKITKNILPTNNFLLSHFLLLYYDHSGQLLSQKYILDVTKKWELNRQVPNKLNSILYNVSLLQIYYRLNKYSQTTPLYNILINDKLFPNSSIKLKIYRYLDYSMYRLGYYDHNLDIARNFTLPLAKYLDKKSTELRIKFTFGINLYSIGKIKRAEQVYQEVLNEIKNKKTNIKASSLYNNLALTYYKLGKYDKYLDLQLQALKYAREKKNYSHQINILNNLFIYYRKSNNEQTALGYLDQALSLAKEMNKATDLGTIYMLKGSFYRRFKKNFEKAHYYFSKAQKNLNSKNSTSYYIQLLNEQAETYEEQHLFNKALKKHNEILKLTPEQNNPDHIDALINKTLIYLKIGKLKKAKRFISQFKNYDLSKLDFQQIVKSKTVEASYLNKTGHSQKALDILKPTLNQVVIRAKNSADIKSGFWHVEDEYLDAFDLAVTINIDNGHPARAIALLDKFKTINDASLYQNPLVKSSLLNESQLTQYKRLTKQLDATRKRLLTAPKGKHFEIRQTISQLKLKKRKLDKKLTDRVDKKPISVRQIQTRLSAHKLVIHMTELKDKYYIADITRSNVDIHTIHLNKKIRGLLSHSIQEVSTHKTNLDSLYALTKLLGLKRIPDRINKITIIPDSYFYQLPIDILPLDKPDHSYSYGEVRYVIEKYQTHYLTSLDDFQLNDNSRPNSSQINFAGYGISNFNGYKNKSLVPLPYAKTEVKSISQNLTHLSKVQTYINNAATKKAFTKTAPDAQIIHLATHSQVSERDPMFSTIYMSDSQKAADSTFNNQIFAYELFDLNLNNEMIMLNSCESGSGTYIQGTGVMGISRALQYAGANSLILNLWSVNDMMASDFAVHFYEQLNQGKSKTEALQNTKRYFLRTKNASPHYWGPYMLIGSSEPIVSPQQNMNRAMAGIFIGYFLLMVGLSYLTDQGIIFNRNNKKVA